MGIKVKKIQILIIGALCVRLFPSFYMPVAHASSVDLLLTQSDYVVDDYLVQPAKKIELENQLLVKPLLLNGHPALLAFGSPVILGGPMPAGEQVFGGPLPAGGGFVVINPTYPIANSAENEILSYGAPLPIQSELATQISQDNR